MYEEFEREHFRVLQRAHAIFVERSAVRGQLWLEFPPSDKLRELRERLMRMEAAYETVNWEKNQMMEVTMIEDALDTINYAAFFIKQIERGMRG